MNDKSARIISLVPSWTETLLWAGLNVVGRTRFCIHPEPRVKAIAAVGGTKGADIMKILELKPDYVIMDQEENRKELADQLLKADVKILVSHVSDLESAGAFLTKLGETLESKSLSELGERYRYFQKNLGLVDGAKFFLKCVTDGNVTPSDLSNLEYVIWKNPYMVIGAKTFISDVLNLAGVNLTRVEKYPEVSEDELKKRFCLFSSEPFPFGKEFPQLIQSGFRGAVIDGEKISWYGIRNLNFLESCLK